jgi:hypothetical protein
MPSGCFDLLSRYLIPRQAWTDYQPRVAEMAPMREILAVTVHHSGFPEGFCLIEKSAAAENLRHILAFHTAPPPTGRGWADVGYHFAIDPAGRIWELRSLNFQGAHVKNHNAGNIGVVCLGNFDIHPLPDAQLSALRQVLRGIEERFGKVRMAGHREIADEATSCPGRHLMHMLWSIRHQD